ncbi:MAG: hypothetical protein NHG12_00035 [Candidatus Shikimatogenerans bostrichidophilus]|nr:MAG: hypothetical protein NHG12_00035 [Candidatus Shikimatogenerans bostrichidophilus]
MKILNNNKWYILKIKNGLEKIIKKKILNLKKKMKFLVKFFIPVKKEIKIINGKKKLLKINFYPGYLIINIFLNEKILYKIKNINGVLYFLNERINNLPLPLNDNEINNIINNYYKYNTFKEKDNNLLIDYKIGENVKIKYGVFKNLNGIIENIYKKKNIVELSVIILSRKIIIKLKINQIQKIYKK